jgi:hypothetical protein
MALSASALLIPASSAISPDFSGFLAVFNVFITMSFIKYKVLDYLFAKIAKNNCFSLLIFAQFMFPLRVLCTFLTGLCVKLIIPQPKKE